MKQIFSAFLFLTVALSATQCSGQATEDKSKRPSPPATFTSTSNDPKITINYSQPAVKGRTIGKDIAPYGQVWRTGANEATTFEVNRDVKVEGQPLKAGKYSLFTIPGENEWKIIFNSVIPSWGIKQGGEANREAANDALTVSVKPTKAPQFTERMTFAQKGDKIALMWGDTEVAFTVK